MAVIWHAYIDESGVDANSSVAVVGSVVATAKTWQELQPCWIDVLKTYGLTKFHAVEFNRGGGECGCLSKKKRDNCVADLIAVLAGSDLEYLCCSVRQNLFDMEKAKMPECQLSVYDYLLASTIGRIGLKWESKKDVDVLVSIEDGCPLSTTVSDILMRQASRGELLPIRKISYDNSAICPLQIADMIVYDTFKSLDNYKKNPNAELRPSFKKIIKGNPLSAEVFDEKCIKDDLPSVIEFLKPSK